MNTKVIYAAAGGIAAAAIAIFFVLGSGNIALPGRPNATPVQISDVQVALDDINVEQIDDDSANVQVIFTAHNPNRGTAILETIHYTLTVGEFQMTSGDIGTSPEGFVASQAGTFTIVSNTTITLRDTQVTERNSLVADSWESMVDGTAQYLVEGHYIYRVTGGNFETTPGEKDFSVTFP